MRSSTCPIHLSPQTHPIICRLRHIPIHLSPQVRARDVELDRQTSHEVFSRSRVTSWADEADNQTDEPLPVTVHVVSRILHRDKCTHGNGIGRARPHAVLTPTSSQELLGQLDAAAQRKKRAKYLLPDDAAMLFALNPAFDAAHWLAQPAESVAEFVTSRLEEPRKDIAA